MESTRLYSDKKKGRDPMKRARSGGDMRMGGHCKARMDSYTLLFLVRYVQTADTSKSIMVAWDNDPQ